MAILQKELLAAQGNISPAVTSKHTLPINAGLQKPPLQLDPISHSAKPIKMQNLGGPLSSLNFAEKANRPTLDPINLKSAKKSTPRGISSTSRSGFNNDPTN